jgi:hypothetical protein
VLKIDQRQYTPMVLDKIAFAGGSYASWKKGARALAKLATLDISAKEVSRITLQIGQELLERHERDAAFQQRRQLAGNSAFVARAFSTLNARVYFVYFAVSFLVCFQPSV